MKRAKWSISSQRLRARRSAALCAARTGEIMPRDVYFIAPQDELPPFVKIGSAFDVELRISELQIGSPVLLEIVMIVERGGEALERMLHAKFARRRLHGEWFSLCPEIRDEMQRLNKLFGGLR